jgi:hypothetical protein
MITLNKVTKEGIILSIDEISCGETHSSGKYVFDHVVEIARLITAHQIGTVLLSASGILFPRRVESTKIALELVLKYP